MIKSFMNRFVTPHASGPRGHHGIFELSVTHASSLALSEYLTTNVDSSRRYNIAVQLMVRAAEVRGLAAAAGRGVRGQAGLELANTLLVPVATVLVLDARCLKYW